jgi:uncharacterized protein
MKSPIRILAVDGGGVGGMIPARLLQRMGPRVIEQADLVAGTSTGGLIALGLAAGQTSEQLCDLYLNRIKDVFSSSNRRFIVRRLWRAKYRNNGLRQAVESIVGQKTLGDLTAKPALVPVTALARADGAHHPAGVFLSTAYRLTGELHEEKYGSSHWKCVDIALSTAAAPTYFPAHETPDPRPNQTGKWVCWDGGIVANDPALAAYGEILRLDLAAQKCKVRTEAAPPPEVRVLSLGCGYRSIKIDAGDWGLLQSAQPVVAGLLDASVGSTAFLLRQVLGDRVLRVSPPLAADYAMDDPKAVPGLNDLANKFYDMDRTSIRQPDFTLANLDEWLNKYWF